MKAHPVVNCLTRLQASLLLQPLLLQMPRHNMVHIIKVTSKLQVAMTLRRLQISKPGPSTIVSRAMSNPLQAQANSGTKCTPSSELSF